MRSPKRYTMSVMVLAMLASPGSSWAGEAGAEPYPESISTQAAQFIAKQSLAQLKAAFDHYRTPNRKQWQRTLTQLGWTTSDLATLDAQLPTTGDKTPVASRWVDQSIVLEAAGNRVEIGVAEYVRGTLRVNGAAFRWSSQRSAADNLKAYKALFNATGEAHASLWDYWIPSARAEDKAPPFDTSGILAVQIEGLKIQSFVSAKGGRIALLQSYAKEADNGLKACNETAPAQLYPQMAADNQKLGAMLAGFADDLSQPENNAFFRDCNDIRKYAKEVTMLYNGSDALKIVNSLCSKLTTWSKCVAAGNLTRATATGTKGDLATPQPDDWSDHVDLDPHAKKAGE